MERFRALRGIIWSCLGGLGFGTMWNTGNPLWLVFCIPFVVFIHNRFLDYRDLKRSIKKKRELDRWNPPEQ